MDQNKLALLEEKLKTLIDKFQLIKSERDELLRIKEENINKIGELEERIKKLQEDRNEILEIVNNLISLIDETDNPKKDEFTGEN